jgi:hypothetical protein
MAISISVLGQIPPPGSDPEAPLSPELNPVVRDTIFSASVVAFAVSNDEFFGPTEVIEEVSAEIGRASCRERVSDQV